MDELLFSTEWRHFLRKRVHEKFGLRKQRSSFLKPPQNRLAIAVLLFSEMNGRGADTSGYLYICAPKLVSKILEIKESLNNDDGDDNENSKTLDWQNNNFARASRFFVHFFVVARLRR